MATKRSPNQCHSKREDISTLLSQLNFSSSGSSEDVQLHKTISSENVDVDLRKAVLDSSAEIGVVECCKLATVVPEEELASEGVVDLDVQRKKDSRIPRLSALLCDSSSGESAHTSGESISQEEEPKAVTVSPGLQVQKTLQGFLFGQSIEVLHNYLMEIVGSYRDYGIYVSNKLRPKPVEGILCYRKGHEYEVEQQIQGYADGPGVYLCHDMESGEQFILKRIRRQNHRLIGIEFLASHNQDFLPKIYGVYKGQDEISIFQEYVAGGTLLKCDWTICQIQKFAETLLLASVYLHSHDLIHGDLKLMNVMVRNTKDPTSVVIIDFQSAKHPHYVFRKGGHTMLYLPPWHNRILNLTRYDAILKTGDLWAIGCILIWFIMQLNLSDGEKQSHKWNAALWNREFEQIQQQCNGCHPKNGEPKKSSYCEECKEKFLRFLKENGDNVLSMHLCHPLSFEKAEENWALDRLRELLFYLTDVSNVDTKTVDKALEIIQGRGQSGPFFLESHDDMS